MAAGPPAGGHPCGEGDRRPGGPPGAGWKHLLLLSGEGLTASRAAATSAGVVRKPRRACCSRAPLPDRLSFPCLRLAPCLSCAPAARPVEHDPVAVRSATSDLL